MFLAVCLNNNEDKMVGLFEFYHYNEIKQKVSIGYRLSKSVWNKGIATEIVEIVLKYLKSVGIRTITAHIMVENNASKRVLEKNGFTLRYSNISEDFGRKDLVFVDKYILRFE